jgi:hypothetical protein
MYTVPCHVPARLLRSVTGFAEFPVIVDANATWVPSSESEEWNERRRRVVRGRG